MFSWSIFINESRLSLLRGIVAVCASLALTACSGAGPTIDLGAGNGDNPTNGVIENDDGTVTNGDHGTTTANDSNNESSGENNDSDGIDENESDDIPQTERLRISNACPYTIWIQQQNMPIGTPDVIAIASGESHDYAIPSAGLAATRFWPKAACDDDGHNCMIGQSSFPCPPGGCPPPVDSKLEATWGCTLEDQSQCDLTPQGHPMIDTYWNTSAVDGYTFGFTATVQGNTLFDAGAPCEDSNCANLSFSQCPTSDNLSQGFSTNTPAYSSVDLRVRNSLGQMIGCASPCKAFNYPTFGGLGLDESSDAAVMYCCPTPPIGPAQCSAGPIISTQFVALIHNTCHRTVYSYAYDDAFGLRHCSANSKIHITFGPNCP